MSRTYKREYTGSRKYDASCRGHGGCPWCEGNKMFHRNGKDFLIDEVGSMSNTRTILKLHKEFISA